jgi:asparagine synthase (glutamine-hydrolysing)
MTGLAGIHGFESFQGLEGVKKTLSKMASGQAWNDEMCVALGQNVHVLAEDAVVLHGTVDNAHEVRRMLEAEGVHRFETESSKEVVLAALRCWGLESALAQFRGAFAFAWWAGQEKRLTLVRDRMGIVPMYWHQTPQGSLLFATEVGAMLASGLVPRQLNLDALADQIMHGTVHAPKTVVEGVQQLGPGELLVAQEEDVHIHAWWDPADEALGVDEMPPDMRRTHLKETLLDAVSRQLRTPHDVGIWLNGSLANSALATLASEASHTPLSTFSLASDFHELDSTHPARDVARHVGSTHHEIRITAQDVEGALPDFLDAMDVPVAHGLKSYVVQSKLRQAGIEVAMGELGGDSMFAGDPIFQRSVQLAKLNWLASWPGVVRRLAGRIHVALNPGFEPRKTAELMGGHHFDLAHTHPIARQLFLRDDLERLLAKDVPKRHDVFQGLVRELAPGRKSFGLPFLSQVTVAEMRSHLGHSLVRSSQQSASSLGLEVRLPFLDHRVVAAALAAPDSEKFPSSPMPLLMGSLQGRIPEVWGDSHAPLTAWPMGTWMRGVWREECAQGLQVLKDTRAMNADALAALELSFQQEHDPERWRHIWSLTVLGLWLERHGLT